MMKRSGGEAPTAPPLMTSPLPAAEAIRILQEAGHIAGQRRAPYGSCRTLCYRVNGQAVNLGRLRQLAAEVQPAA